jgi:hypothetical protein
VRTVASFREAYQAHLAKGKLETEGISAIVLDEYLVGINWMYSQAIGGVKVQVPEADYERAHKILEGDYAEDLIALDPERSMDSCPECGSPSISVHPYSRWWLIPSLLFLCPVFFGRKKWNCNSCGAVWRDKGKKR